MPRARSPAGSDLAAPGWPLQLSQQNSVASLAKCTKIEIFKLGSNKLTSIEGVGLENMADLKTLFVESNEGLQLIPAVVLEKCVSINRINASGCHADVKGSAFGDLESRCNAAKGRFIM